MYDSDPDIILITESWTREDVKSAEINLEGYSMLRKDRKTRKGGGCLLYHKNDISISEDHHSNSNNETIWCSLRCNSSYIKIGLCYSSPTLTREELISLHQEIKEQCEQNDRVLVCGDFNHRSINWELMHASPEGQEFLDLSQDCFLFQKVLEPTRGENILDLILTNEESMVEEVEVIEPLGKSDHNLIEFAIITEVTLIPWSKTYLNYKRTDLKGFRRHMNQVNWENRLEGTASEMWEVYKDVFQKGVQLYVPVGQRKGGQPIPKWWNRHIRTLRKKRNRRWKKYRESGVYSDYEKYKRALNRVTAALRSSKKRYEKTLADGAKANPKKFFQYARSKTKSKDRVGPLKDSEGAVIQDNRIVAKTLNDYFASVFTHEDTSRLPTPTHKFHGEEANALTDVTVTKDIVYQRLKAIKVDKAQGNDGMHPSLLSNLAEEISTPLAIIIERTLENEDVPEDWRQANVTPIFKKGEKSKAENYRPVSLTSQVSKTAESIIKEAIVDHITTYDTLNRTQHGFIKGRSCLTNLLTFLEEVTDMLDRKLPVDIVYLDFSKAFDKVPHKRLLEKLHAHGVRGKVWTWIKNWLSGRQQRVIIQGETSDWKPVLSGVPQGSVLGPLLFLIYIDDIDENIRSRLLKFADDTKLFGPVATPEQAEILQQDLRQMHYWSKEWQMLFNPGKCKCLHLGFNNLNYDYFVGDNLIESTEEEKDLGVWVDVLMNFSKQCAAAVAKANGVLATIRRTITNKSPKIIIPLYKSLVRPHLEYAVQAWRPFLQRDVDNIEKVQQRALRLITGYAQLTYPQRLKKANLVSLETRRMRGDMIETFKIIKGLEGINREVMFIMRQIRSGNRGHNEKIFKQHSRLDIRKYSFSRRVVDQWNCLKPETVASETINQFKSKIEPMVNERRGLYTSQKGLPAPVGRSSTV